MEDPLGSKSQPATQPVHGEAQHLNQKSNFSLEADTITDHSHGNRIVSPSKCADGFPEQSQSGSAPVDGLSPEQIKCPVIIEVFCGSARVTASLRAIGLSSAFGVDHDTSKAVASAKVLDLSTKHGQDVLLTWLQSPMVVGLFIAPPCGTCSLARCIQLRDSKGRPIPGPRPLRTKDFPEGLPDLRDTERRRVSQANRLYSFVQQ